MNFTFTSLAYDYLKASSNIQHISFKKSHQINVIHCIILKKMAKIQAVKSSDFKVSMYLSNVLTNLVNIVYNI